MTEIQLIGDVLLPLDSPAFLDLAARPRQRHCENLFLGVDAVGLGYVLTMRNSGVGQLVVFFPGFWKDSLPAYVRGKFPE